MVKERYLNYLRLSAIGLFAYMPFHIFLSQWLSTYTGGLEIWKAWKDIFAFLVTILIISSVYFFRKQTRLFSWLVSLTVLYGVIHLILLAATNQPADTGLLAIVYNLRIFGYAILGYGLVLLLPKAGLPRLFMHLLIILSTIVCLVALAQWVLPKDIMTNFGYSIERGVKPNFFIDDKPDLPRVFSTLRDPNSLGAFLIVPIILLVSWTIDKWKTDRRMLLGGLLLLHILALLLAFSRSTLLATFVAAVALLAIKNRSLLAYYKKYWLPGVAVFLVLAGIVVYTLRDAYFVQNVFFHADEATTLADPNELRVDLVQRGIDGVIEQPLGHGPGTAGLVSTRLPGGGLLTENYFLQILYEVGILGFGVFITLLFLIVRSLWIVRKNRYASVLIASFAGLIIANMLFHTWANEAVAISWFMIAGVMLTSPKPES